MLLLFYDLQFYYSTNVFILCSCHAELLMNTNLVLLCLLTLVSYAIFSHFIADCHIKSLIYYYCKHKVVPGTYSKLHHGDRKNIHPEKNFLFSSRQSSVVRALGASHGDVPLRNYSLTITVKQISWLNKIRKCLLDMDMMSLEQS